MLTGIGLGNRNWHMQLNTPVVTYCFHGKVWSTIAVVMVLSICYTQDGQGRERTIRQPFTLDNTKIPFGRIPRFILLAHHSLLVRTMHIAGHTYYV